MKRHCHWFRLLRLGLALLALLPAGARVSAAVLTPEEIAWSNARSSFELFNWPQADARFAEFLKKYPASRHYTDGVITQAQARIYLGHYNEAIQLLTDQQVRSENQADEFSYWIGMAYCSNLNYQAAADTFALLVQEHTNSARRPEALFTETAARMKLAGELPRLIEELSRPDSPLQQMAVAQPTNEWVMKTAFRLCEAELALTNIAGAEKTLGLVAAGSALEWERQYLLVRVKLAGGHPEVALPGSASLIEAAGVDAKKKTESISVRGNIYRRLGDYQPAISTYQTNLNSTNDASPDQRREALLNIVELNLAQNQVEEAARSLEDYLFKSPAEKDSDLNLLLLGELRLKQHYSEIRDTNHLASARSNFDTLTIKYPNSGYLGKAQLNLGWCFSAEGKIAESLAAFSNAVEHLPPSEDQAVALFKLGETRLAGQDYTGAAGSFNRLIDQYGSMPLVTNELFEPALYHILQADTALTNLSGAAGAFDRIRDWFPGGFLGESGALLVGQTVNREGQPAAARAIYAKFRAQWPNSSLRPEMELLEARTYERENDWTNAISQYTNWVATYTNQPSLPDARFSLAWAYWEAGDETNAFQNFTQFLSDFPTNALAAQAQYWIGDHYVRTREFTLAAISFQQVAGAKSNAAPALVFNARMMAGVALFATQDAYGEAKTNFFEPLARDPQCPPDLRLEALFASGDATLKMATTTNLVKSAISIFEDITKNNPTNRLAPLAWGRIGDCYLMLGVQDPSSYATATNAYQKVIEATDLAEYSARCKAEFCLAQAIEKAAQARAGDERKQLLNDAVGHYENVVIGVGLQPGEAIAPAWAQRAGFAAGRVLGDELGRWEDALRLYQKLENSPELAERIVTVRAHLK
jgi:TolA-binding protein